MTLVLPQNGGASSSALLREALRHPSLHRPTWSLFPKEHLLSIEFIVRPFFFFWGICFLKNTKKKKKWMLSPGKCTREHAEVCTWEGYLWTWELLTVIRTAGSRGLCQSLNVSSSRSFPSCCFVSFLGQGNRLALLCSSYSTYQDAENVIAFCKSLWFNRFF